MRCVKKWYRLTITVGMLSLFTWTCGTDFRDAVIAGAFDFVSDSVNGMLANMTQPPQIGG